MPLIIAAAVLSLRPKAMDRDESSTRQMLEADEQVSPPQEQRESTKTRRDGATLLAVLLIAATLSTYLQVISFPFLVLDDNQQIVQNEAVHHWSALPSYFTHDVWESGSAGARYYRPFLHVWLLVNYKLFGLHPMPWHAALLLLYALCVILFWRLLLSAGIEQTTAFFTSLLFALHPVHVESVAWLTGGVDVLLGVFVFGGLLAYFKWSKSGRWGWLALAGILALAAMWTKETGVALPVLMILHSLFFAPDLRENLQRRMMTWVGAVVPVAIYALSRANALHTSPQQSWANVASTAPMLSSFFLRQALWPVRLAGWYDLEIVRGWPVSAFWIPCVAGMISVAIILIGLKRRNLAAYFGAFWWITLAPSLAGVRVFLQNDIAHDRYNYLAVAAVCFLVVSGLKFIPRLPVAIPRVLLLVLALLLAVVTVRQVKTWHSNEALYRRALEVSPLSIRPRNLLVGELLKKGQPREALQLARSTVELAPQEWESNFVLGVTLLQNGQMFASEGSLRKCIQLNPKVAVPYIVLANVLRVTDPEQALAVLRSAPPDVDDPGLIAALSGEIQRARGGMSR